MFKAYKKPVENKFFFAAYDGVCVTKEGIVPYKTGDAILTGVKGEEWPIPYDTFITTYDYSVEHKICTKKKIVVNVEQINEPFSVVVAWAMTPIYGKAGDYRVSNEEGTDTWIVDQEIFNETYVIL